MAGSFTRDSPLRVSNHFWPTPLTGGRLQNGDSFSVFPKFWTNILIYMDNMIPEDFNEGHLWFIEGHLWLTSKIVETIEKLLMRACTLHFLNDNKVAQSSFQHIPRRRF